MRAYLSSHRVEELKNGFLDKISTIHSIGANFTAQFRPRPLFFGSPYYYGATATIAGGGGYVLNQAALKLFGQLGVPTWFNNATDSREDFIMGWFFADNFIYISDTQDEAGGGRFGGTGENAWRYNGIGPNLPWYLWKKYGLANDCGIDAVSKQQISFHMKDDKGRLNSMGYSTADENYRYHALFNDWCGPMGYSGEASIAIDCDQSKCWCRAALRYFKMRIT